MTWAVLASLCAVSAGCLLLIGLAERRRYERVAVAVVAIAAAVAAATICDAAPTGSAAWDGVLRGAWAGALVLAASSAAPLWLAAAAGVVGVACAMADRAPQPSAVLAGLALGLAASSLLTRHRNRVVCAIAGGAVAYASMGLTWPDRTGGPSMVAAVGTAVLLVGGWVGADRVGRRCFTAATLAVAGATAVSAGLALSVGLGISGDAREAISALRRGVDLSAAGDRNEALESFTAAQLRLAETHSRLDGWQARLLNAVPVVAQNLDAARTAVEVGQQLSQQAAQSLELADPSTLRGPGGSVNVVRVGEVHTAITSMGRVVSEGSTRLGGLSSPWIVSPVARRLNELTTELTDEQPKIERAARLTEVLPGLLGADRERRFFLAVMTPSETRGTIGIIGNYAELTARDGRLEVPVSGRDDDLNFTTDWRNRTLNAPAEYVSRYQRLQPQRFWQEVTASPDFPTVAGVIADLYPQSGGRAVDGVIAVDPFALQALLRLTGPITVNGWAEPLTAKNAAQILLFDQYVVYDTANPEENRKRARFLTRATEQIFARLVSADIEPGQLAKVLGEMVRQRHLMVTSFEPQEAAVFDELHASGAFPRPDGRDVLGVVTYNTGGNKIDWFLHRTIHQRTTIAASGELRADLTIDLRNDAPSSGLPNYIISGATYAPDAAGTNLQFVSIYTPHEATGASIGGKPLDLIREEEFGLHVYSALVSIPPGSSQQLQIQLSGSVTGERYDLSVFQQTMVNDDQWTLEFGGPPGWVFDTSGETPMAATVEGVTAISGEQRVAWEVTGRPAPDQETG